MSELASGSVSQRPREASTERSEGVRCVTAASDAVVAVEAFAAATPVVAFAIPSLREVVPESAGFAVPPFDVTEYAKRLAELRDDADLAAAMGAAGRRFAAGYDWDALAARQAEVYRATAAEVPVR